MDTLESDHVPPKDLPSLAGLVRPEPWMADARCRALDIPTDVFFPTRGEDTTLAKEVCAPCPVRRECLDYALDNGEHFGVFGGASERERRRMRRQRAVMRGRDNAPKGAA